MFQVNDDKSIYVTRGDIVFLSVSAENDGEAYIFQPGDLVRMKVFGKKDCENVVLEKDFPIVTASDVVEIFLDENDTKIGEVISKPTDYWYEIELNPLSEPQTIIGYDEDGAKVFKLFPEGADIEVYVPTEEDIPFVDDELDLTSPRPVANQAVAREIERLKYTVHVNSDDIELAKTRIDNVIAPEDSGNKVINLAYANGITDGMKAKVDAVITSDGIRANVKVMMREANIFYEGTAVNLFVVPEECRPLGTGLVHTEDGLYYNISYNIQEDCYYLSITAKSGVVAAPSSAGEVTFTYQHTDLEARDIRIGADGKKYKTAGEAVRRQIHGANVGISEQALFEKAHNPIKLTNLFDINAYNQDGYYKHDTGEFVESDEYKSSGFIPCVPGEKIVSNVSGRVTFWTKDRVYLAYVDSGKEFVVPSKAYYFSGIISKGAVETAWYVSKENVGASRKVLKSDVFLRDENLEYTQIKRILEKIVRYTSNNLFNINDFNDEFFFNTNGARATLNGYGSTGFISCDAEATYTKNSGGYVTFWDSEFAFISSDTSNNTFTTPKGCAYMNVAFQISKKDTFYIVPADEEFEESCEILLGRKYKDLKYGTLGDSLTYGLTAETCYGKIASDEMGMNFTNYGISGNRLASTDNDSNSSPMCVRFATMADDLDIITVMGGTNDYSAQVPIGTNDSTDITTFKGALNVLCSGLVNKYSGKRIGFLTPTQRRGNDNEIKMEEYVNAIIEICGQYSIPVLDLYHKGGITTKTSDKANGLLTDGTHLSNEGHAVIARKVIRFIEEL
jgi:lysophospholipase L1-like esterase